MNKKFTLLSIGLIMSALIIGVIAFGKGNAVRLQVFENQITQLESYRTDIGKQELELCYEGIELDSRDFYKQEFSVEDRKEFRRINTVASFVNELGFELEDFSAELYLKSQDGKYVECITFYGGKWYCITQNMQSGSIKTTTYDCLDINEGGSYKEYKMVSAKEEKVLFKLSYKNLEDYEIGNEELQHTTLYLSGYTGYIDENAEFAGREYFKNLDIDQDGLIDRVYRKQLDWEFCSIEVHFGDKSTLLVEKVYSDSVPDFILLPSDSKDTLIAFRDYYPGAVGVVVNNDIKFFKKENNQYIETPLPFSEISYSDSLNNGSWNQYVNVNVSLVDANKRTVAYTCREFPEFYEEITMSEEDYRAGDFAWMFENGNGNIDGTDCKVFSIEISEDGTNTIICKAHVVYHCSDEIAFVMKYIDDKWQVLEIGMSRGKGYTPIR